MKHCVEFYFSGLSLAGHDEKEVSSRELDEIVRIPENAISCRFFDKNDNGDKLNFSSYYFFGKEYSLEEFKRNFPQLADSDFAQTAKRVVKALTGAFYPLSEEDVVITL